MIRLRRRFVSPRRRCRPFPRRLEQWPRAGAPDKPRGLVSAGRPKRSKPARRAASTQPDGITDADAPRSSAGHGTCRRTPAFSSHAVIRAPPDGRCTHHARVCVSPTRDRPRVLVRRRCAADRARKAKCRDEGIPRVTGTRTADRLEQAAGISWSKRSSGVLRAALTRADLSAERSARPSAGGLLTEPDRSACGLMSCRVAAGRAARPSRRDDPAGIRDRSRWNRGPIVEGGALVERRARRAVWTESARARCSRARRSPSPPDGWPQQLACTTPLLRVSVRTGRRAEPRRAVAMRDGPQAVDPIDAILAAAHSRLIACPPRARRPVQAPGSHGRRAQRYERALSITQQEQERRSGAAVCASGDPGVRLAA